MTQAEDASTPPSLGRQLADRLRRDILTGALPPGTALKEREQALELGVSRTPLREAIRILSEEGLVVLRPARSPVVADPTLAEVSDNLVVMIALEVLCGRLACSAATGEDLASVQAALTAMEAEASGRYGLPFFERDMAFHAAIAAASHNGALIRTHREYVARLWRARFLSASARQDRERVLAEHGDILAALEARAPDAAQAAIELHLANSFRHIGEVYDETGSRASVLGAPGSAR